MKFLTGLPFTFLLELLCAELPGNLPKADPANHFYRRRGPAGHEKSHSGLLYDVEQPNVFGKRGHGLALLRAILTCFQAQQMPFLGREGEGSVKRRRPLRGMNCSDSGEILGQNSEFRVTLPIELSSNELGKLSQGTALALSVSICWSIFTGFFVRGGFHESLCPSQPHSG